MASPRLAAKAPTACAACYLARPGVPHIDYGAAIEGRLIDPSRPRGGHIDWVIICENCLRNGVALLPADEDPQADLVAELEATAERYREAAEAAQTYIKSLEAAFAAREHVHPTVTPVEKPKPEPRPKTVGKRPRQPRYEGAK